MPLPALQFTFQATLRTEKELDFALWLTALEQPRKCLSMEFAVILNDLRVESYVMNKIKHNWNQTPLQGLDVKKGDKFKMVWNTSAYPEPKVKPSKKRK